MSDNDKYLKVHNAPLCRRQRGAFCGLKFKMERSDSPQKVECWRSDSSGLLASNLILALSIIGNIALCYIL